MKILPKKPGSLDRKYDAPTSGNSPNDVSGMANTYIYPHYLEKFQNGNK